MNLTYKKSPGKKSVSHRGISIERGKTGHYVTGFDL